VARALAAAVAGTLTPAAAAEQAQAAVERLADKVAARGGG
jgi:hypothetical protein